MHFHMHVIARFHGDASEPRGGIRWVPPDKAPYWRPLLGDSDLASFLVRH